MARQLAGQYSKGSSSIDKSAPSKIEVAPTWNEPGPVPPASKWWSMLALKSRRRPSAKTGDTNEMSGGACRPRHMGRCR